MKIKYAGPRPTISHHGIAFKDGKEDKYVYLMIGVQILKAIDKNYEEQKSYTYDVQTKRVDDETMLETIRKYESSIDKEVQEELDTYSQHIDDEIEQVRQSHTIKDIEKEIWINNIKIMKNYRLQRAVNKIYYMHCINNIKKVIVRENIKELITPFFEKYWHTLQTIQGKLENGLHSRGTDLKVFKDNNSDMMIKLTVE